MSTVEDFANEFVSRGRRGEAPRVRVSPDYAEAFLGTLAREGVRFARRCLDQISDPALRRVIETVFFSAAAGAALGASIGGIVAGAPGAQVGAVVGSAVGFATGVIALTLVARQDGGDLVLSFSTP